MHWNLKRLFDLNLSVLLSLFFVLPFLCIVVLIRMTSTGAVFHRSKRVGKNNDIFVMYKFRTMSEKTPDVATHLLHNPEDYVTPLGRYLRKTSIDELPQLYNIIRGEMSFVGPRPALFNQTDLIELRSEKGVHRLVPGLTGWAQVYGRDELSIPDKVDKDLYYLEHQSFWLDLGILARTLFSVCSGKGVCH